MRLDRYQERGDTIIEVLFAVAVFAMVAVGCLSIMNQGTATAQRSLEITLVRQQIDAQAEAIRFIHQAYVANYHKGATAPTGIAAQWLKMTVDLGATTPSEFGKLDGAQCAPLTHIEHPFILNAHTATVWSQQPTTTPPEDGSLPPFAQVNYYDDDSSDGVATSINAAYGIWVEAVPSSVSSQGAGYVDFHIRACWESPGARTPVTLGTIVRLYEPR